MKQRIAVLFGGPSAEHEISVITALQAMQAIDTTRYHFFPVYLTPEGRWYTGDALFQKETYRNLALHLSKLTRLMLLPEPDIQGFLRYGASPEDGMAHYPVDACLLCFHGQKGEDGCVQGLLELADLPYTSSGLLPSALSMHKGHCKAVLSQHGIAVLPWCLVTHEEAKEDFAAACQRAMSLGAFPLFVKPCHLGSSIGVSRVESEDALARALALVFRYDEVALIEPCVERPLEINISVFQTDEGLLTSPCEIPVATAGVLTYEDKYMRGGKGKGGLRESGMASLTRVIDPPDLDPAIKESVTTWATQGYKLIGAKGVVRFDFLYDPAKEKLYFNELNPLPGSLSFYLWEKAKPRLLYTKLLDQLIASAITHHRKSRGYSLECSWRTL